MFPQSDIITAIVAPAKLLYRVIHVFSKLSVNSLWDCPWFYIVGIVRMNNRARLLELRFREVHSKSTVGPHVNGERLGFRPFESFLCGPPNATTNLLRPFVVYEGCRGAFPPHVFTGRVTTRYRRVNCSETKVQGPAFLPLVNEGVVFFFRGAEKRGREGRTVSFRN